MTTIRYCPALLIGATASGQGKTTLVAALARYHRQQGRRVRVFKTGPDFLDPKIHEQASGNTVHQLDLWMVGDGYCRKMLYEAAAEADIILVEGVMGLFDGTPSSADLAVHFGLPVAVMIDAGAMAQTFGAIAKGLVSYRDDLNVVGVIANKVASVGHQQMLEESLPAGVNWLAGIPRVDAITLPERHLGLHQPDSIADLDSRLDQAAALIANTPLANLPPPVAFTAGYLSATPKLLSGITIAVASDSAFSFVYPANLDLLNAMGAQLVSFSPMHDRELPACDSLYLPGGYPELHLDTLADNQTMLESIRAHYQQGKSIVAECGGMLYLLDSLAQKNGYRRNLVGIIAATATMQPKLSGLGAQSAIFDGGEMRGHTFHYSAFDVPPTFQVQAVRNPSGVTGEGVICDGAVTASYVHWYLPSNPQLAAAMFNGSV